MKRNRSSLGTYKWYLELRSVRLLKHDLDRRGVVSKIRVSKNGTRSGGRPFSRGALYELLANPIYIGEIRHKAIRHPGQHDAILDRETWEEVQRRLRDQTARDGSPKIKTAASVLAGKLFDEQGEPLYATGSKRSAWWPLPALCFSQAGQRRLFLGEQGEGLAVGGS
jgi:site-specific DNA recombinase